MTTAALASHRPMPFARNAAHRGNPLRTGYASLFAGALALVIAASLLPSPAWAVGALGGFLALGVMLAWFAPATFVLLLPLLVLRFTEFVSGVAIESGAFMVETRVTGEPTGAFARLLLIYLPFFAIFTAVVERFWPRVMPWFQAPENVWEARIRPVAWSVAVACGAVLLFVMWLGLDYGYPLLSGEDRFAYRARVDSPLFRFFLNNRVLLAPLIGLLLTNRRYRWGGIAAMAWLLVASLLVGEKFTSLVGMMTQAVIPVGLWTIANRGRIPVSTMAKVAAAIMVVTIPAVLHAYGARDSVELAVDRFADRVALQGQLWYMADCDHFSYAAFDGEALAADARTWADPAAQDPRTVGTAFGLYYVMHDFTRSQELRWIMETGNGFVFSLLPYLLKATGLLGLGIIMAVIAAYHAGIALALALCIGRVNVLALLLVGRVSMYLYGFYVSGWFWNVFGVKNLAAIVLALLAIWLGRYRLRLR